MYFNSSTKLCEKNIKEIICFQDVGTSLYDLYFKGNFGGYVFDIVKESKSVFLKFIPKRVQKIANFFVDVLDVLIFRGVSKTRKRAVGLLGKGNNYMFYTESINWYFLFSLIFQSYTFRGTTFLSQRLKSTKKRVKKRPHPPKGG